METLKPLKSLDKNMVVDSLVLIRRVLLDLEKHPKKIKSLPKESLLMELKDGRPVLIPYERKRVLFF